MHTVGLARGTEAQGSVGLEPAGQAAVGGAQAAACVGEENGMIWESCS